MGLLNIFRNSTTSTSPSGLVFGEPAFTKVSSIYRFFIGGNASDNVEIPVISGSNSSWTPADGSGSSLSFTVVSATFSKIGNIVTFQTKITYPVTATTPNAVISGLPFASANESSVLVFMYAGASFAGIITGSSINIYVLSTGIAAINSALSGQTITISGSYQV